MVQIAPNLDFSFKYCVFRTRAHLKACALNHSLPQHFKYGLIRVVLTDAMSVYFYYEFRISLSVR